MLSLLLDDLSDDYSQKYWNIFYHFLIDGDSLSLVHKQAKRLIDLSKTIDTWHGSIYGSILRIVNKDTLSQLRCIWEKYSETVRPDQRLHHDRKFRDGWRKVVDDRRETGKGRNFTGIRAAGPLFSVRNTSAAYLHFKGFWDTGVAGGNSSDIASAKYPNPMFLYTSIGDEFIVHGGTDPLLGFHLEMAYEEVLADGPLGDVSDKSKSRAKSRQQFLDHLTKVAKRQFKEWSKAFKVMAKRKKLIARFYLGDALRFCRSMAICRENGVDASSFDFAQAWQATPLKLDGGDYEASSPSPAPMSFDVIETSNLTDHIGLLNLLIAAAAVLSPKPSSVLYTETFNGRSEDQTLELPYLLCGDAITMSLLLGLAPVGYVTGTISGSSAQENYDRSLNLGSCQSHIRISWKQPMLGDGAALEYFDGLQCRIAPKDLAMVLFQIYLKMFQWEGTSNFKRSFEQQESQRFRPFYLYTRETYAEFLALVKKRLDNDWPDVISILCQKIANDRSLDTGISMLDSGLGDLFLHMHQSGVYRMNKPPQYYGNPSLSFPSLLHPGALSKPMIPTVVTVVLIVPRQNLVRIFIERKPNEKFMVTLCASIHGPRGLTSFSSIQTVFGKLVHSRDGLSATIIEDVDGWNGISDLIVSFCVPTDILLAEGPREPVIAFHLVPSPFNTILQEVINSGYLIYETSLLSHEVSVFRNPPGIPHSRPAIESPPSPPSIASANPNPHISNVMVHFDSQGRVENFKSHVDLGSPESWEILNSIESTIIQTSPCTLEVLTPGIGSKTLAFPYPVDGSRAELKVSKPLFWPLSKFTKPLIEVSVPPSRATDSAGFNLRMLPVVNRQPPIVWDMPRVNLDRLPILNTESCETTNEWLPIHLTCMYSNGERLSQGQGDISSLKSNLKDSIASIFLNASGNVTKGQKSQVFAISPPDQDKVQILIFVANIRFDFGSRTVVADARVLLLTEHIALSEAQALAALRSQGIIELVVDNEEYERWKGILPALVERCRTWKHTASCEYREHGIPVLGESPLCSCGVGKAPQTLLEVEGWKPFEKYWSRAAIAPIFAFPYAESSSMAVKDLVKFRSALKPLGATGNSKILGVDKKAPKKYEKVLKVVAKAPDVGEKAVGVVGAAEPPVDSVCQNCRRKPQAGMFVVCKGCRKVRYCSVACQKEDRRRHKSVCKL